MSRLTLACSLASVILLMLVAGACSPPCVSSFPAPQNQPLGGPCADRSECATGLLCEATVVSSSRIVQPGGAESRATSACTKDCGNGSCPSGSVCVDGGFGLCPVADCQAGASCPGGSSCSVHADSTAMTCLPSCSVDDDCRKGLRAGRCVLADGKSKACVPIVCIQPSDCPSGFQCALAGGTCGAGGGAVMPSWCRREGL